MFCLHIESFYKVAKFKNNNLHKFMFCFTTQRCDNSSVSQFLPLGQEFLMCILLSLRCWLLIIFWHCKRLWRTTVAVISGFCSKSKSRKQQRQQQQNSGRRHKRNNGGGKQSERHGWYITPALFKNNMISDNIKTITMLRKYYSLCMRMRDCIRSNDMNLPI